MPSLSSIRLFFTWMIDAISARGTQKYNEEVFKANRRKWEWLLEDGTYHHFYGTTEEALEEQKKYPPVGVNND